MKYINWRINVDSGIPLYVQIAGLIRKYITDGVLPVGSKLSQRHIADQLKISRKPVADAIETLEAEGLLETKSKSGTVVTNNVWTRLNRTQDSFWQMYTKSGRGKSSPHDVLTVFEKMEDTVSVKVDSDRLASSFSPHLPMVKAMPNVAKRLEETDDMGFFALGGLTSLKHSLCKHMERYGINATEDEVVITSGIGESISLICAAFIGSGVNFIYDTPSFINSTMLVQSTGCNMYEVPMDEEGMNTADLITKLRRMKNAILYVQPVNHIPTGTHMTSERRNTILSICGEYNVPIIENDLYRDFYYEKPFPRPLKAFDHNNQVIYIGTLLNGFMGYKQSWIVAPKFIRERLTDLSTHIELVPNTFQHMFADEMLTSGYYYEYLDYVRPLMVEQYYAIQALLEKHLSDLATWRKDYPSFYIWLRFRDDVKLLDKFRDSKEYLFFPGVMFNWSDKHHVRLNIFAVKSHVLEEWIQMISTLLRDKR